MQFPIDKIAESILLKSKSLSVSEKEHLDNTIRLGNTFVELLALHAHQANAPLQNILDPVIDEVFVDLHIATTLAMGGQYKAACVLLRTCIETGLYILYFTDHPIEAIIWANAPANMPYADMSFVDTLEKMTEIAYLRAASDRDPDKSEVEKIRAKLRKNYRLLSERVHGKFSFLQSTAPSDTNLFDVFVQFTKGSLSALIKLGLIKAADEQFVLEKIPALENVK